MAEDFYTQTLINQVIARYNPDNDTIQIPGAPDVPDVTWADRQLAEALDRINHRLHLVEATLERVVSALESINRP